MGTFRQSGRVDAGEGAVEADGAGGAWTGGLVPAGAGAAVGWVRATAFSAFTIESGAHMMLMKLCEPIMLKSGKSIAMRNFTARA